MRVVIPICNDKYDILQTFAWLPETNHPRNRDQFVDPDFQSDLVHPGESLCPLDVICLKVQLNHALFLSMSDKQTNTHSIYELEHEICKLERLVEANSEKTSETLMSSEPEISPKVTSLQSQVEQVKNIQFLHTVIFSSE